MKKLTKTHPIFVKNTVTLFLKLVKVAALNITFLFSGLGEVLAGGAFGIFGQFLSIKRKTPIIILGFVCCITAYILIFINIPKESPFGETDIIEHVSFIGKN